MSQQINLYSPIFRKQSKVFSAATMLQGALLVSVIVAVAYVYLSLQTSVLEIRAAQSGTELKSELERLKTYTVRESPEARAKSLAERKKALQATLQASTQTLEALEKGGLGRAEGYSELLRALARVSVQGVWLTRVHFAEGSGELSLTGRAARADQVAAYLERLRSEPELRGREFARLDMKRGAAEKGAPPYVEFALSSSDEGPGK
jgi:hypothetical protein